MNAPLASVIEVRAVIEEDLMRVEEATFRSAGHGIPSLIPRLPAAIVERESHKHIAVSLVQCAAENKHTPEDIVGRVGQMGRGAGP